MQRKENPSSLKSTISEKIMKKWQKVQFFWGGEMDFSAIFFLIFQEMVYHRDLRFFVLHLVHQTPSFEVSVKGCSNNSNNALIQKSQWSDVFLCKEANHDKNSFGVNIRALHCTFVKQWELH